MFLPCYSVANNRSSTHPDSIRHGHRRTRKKHGNGLEMELELNDITQRMIGSFFRVSSVRLTFDFFAWREEHCMRNPTICRKSLVSTDETKALKFHVYERQRRSLFTNANGVPDRSPGSRALRAHPGLRPTYMTLPQRPKGPKGALQL